MAVTPDPKKMTPEAQRRLFIYAVLVVLILGIFVVPRFLPAKSTATPSYSALLKEAKHQKVVSAEINNVSGVITGQLSNGKNYVTNGPVPSSTNEVGLLRADNVPVTFTNGSSLLGLLLPILIWGLLLVGLIVFIGRQQKNQMSSVMSIGKSKAKAYSEDRPKTTFADVAGYAGVKAEISEVVEFLKTPGRYQSIGATIPRGILLVGPPGTGKTLLARAVAGEAQVPFFSMSGSDFMEMFVGVGASVTGDTPVLVSRDGEQPSLVPIGEFVDHYYDEGEEGFVVSCPDVQTLGYDKLNTGFRGKLDRFAGSSWKSVQGVYRHRVDEIFEIEYLGGTIRATGDHGVFVRGHGGIKSKAVRDLRPGEVLVTLPFNLRTNFIPGEGTLHEVRSHQFEESEQILLPVVEYDPELVAAYAYARDSASSQTQQAVATQLGVSQATIGDWRSGKKMPQGLTTRRHTTQFVEEVAVTPDLMRLLGYYTAEGRNNGEVEFCFGIHEKDLIADCVQLMRESFGTEADIKERPESSSVVIGGRSAAVGRFFERQCGNGSHNKHIPPLLWTLPREYFLSYLQGYTDGDGYVSTEGKRCAASVSRQLITELAWLCAMHGVKCGVGHGIIPPGRIIRDKPLPSTEYWRLTIGKTSDPLATPTGKAPQEKKPVVRSVTRRPYNGYVYDLCGCDNEAFFGGERPVLLHNSRVRTAFADARKQAPAIIFIDEIDSVGRKRGAGIGGGHDEREQTLNQMLNEMDGFTTTEGVIVMAATNRPDVLDPALLRPGRFDRQVVVPLPEITERQAILVVHAKNKPLDASVDLALVARGTPGMSGADLANLVNEAALGAVRRDSETISMNDFEDARDRVMMGQSRETMVLVDDERERVAFHESGHAVLSYVLENTDPLHKITIIPRGMALGVTMSLPEEDRHIMGKHHLEDSLCMRMGGRVAEMLVYGDLSTGASDDLQRNTELATRMVREWGMSKELGPMAWGPNNQVFLGEDLMHQRDYSDHTSQIVDAEVERILREQEVRATEVLTKHRSGLEALAAALLEHETIDGDSAATLIDEANGSPVWPAGTKTGSSLGGPVGAASSQVAGEATPNMN